MSNPQSQPANAGTAQEQARVTGADNIFYDLVSVTYHAMKGAYTHQQYQQDASGNPTIAQFFHSVQDQDRQRVMLAKEMLRQYLASPQSAQG